MKTDLTPWLEYFLDTLAGVFTAAKNEALRAARLSPIEALRHE